MKIREALVPPNPNELVIACSIATASGLTGHEIEGDRRIWLVEIDGRRRGLFRNRQHGEPGFERAGAAEKVPGHRLGRADREPRRVGTEYLLDRPSLGQIAERRRGRVRVEVLNRRRAKAGVVQRRSHHPLDAVAVFGRRGEVVGIGTHAIADQFGQDVGSSRDRLPDLFEHQDAGPFPDHEPVTTDIPRTARGGRIVVALRQCAHRREPRDAERRDARFRTAADHRVGVTALDEPEGVPDRMRASRAGSRDRRIRALGPEPHRDVAGGEVDDRRQDEERRHPIGTALEQRPMLALDHLETADAAANHHPHAGRIGGLDPEPALLHRHLARANRELDEAGALLHVLAIDPGQRVEAGHLTGEAGRVPRRIE